MMWASAFVFDWVDQAERNDARISSIERSDKPSALHWSSNARSSSASVIREIHWVLDQHLTYDHAPQGSRVCRQYCSLLEVWHCHQLSPHERNRLTIHLA